MLDDLKTFFSRDVAARATAPLKNTIRVLILSGDRSFSLRKKAGVVQIDEVPSPSAIEGGPDLTFTIPPQTLGQLLALTTEDIGEIGIAILKSMVNTNPELRTEAKVHVGVLTLLGKGYLSVLPLGGSGVMKFLASRGFGSLSKVREALARMK